MRKDEAQVALDVESLTFTWENCDHKTYIEACMGVPSIFLPSRAFAYWQFSACTVVHLSLWKELACRETGTLGRVECCV